MTMRPLNERIPVKRLEEEAKSRGGIILPDTAKEKPQQGRVIATGRGRLTEDGKRQPIAVEADERFLFGKSSGSEIELDGEEHLLIREDHVLGVIE
jgi:chaperonin GroES